MTATIHQTVDSQISPRVLGLNKPFTSNSASKGVSDPQGQSPASVPDLSFALLHQCPGCWSYGTHRIPHNGWIECECGEKMTCIDLRGGVIRPRGLYRQTVSEDT